MPSGNAHMYRQLNGRRLLTGMVLAILTLGLIVIDLGMGSSGIGPVKSSMPCLAGRTVIQRIRPSCGPSACP